MRSWKQAVARAFDGAEGYDAAAAIQAVVAKRLAERIAREALAPSPRILEIGCGTGLLTQDLQRRIAPACLIASDIAPAMAQRCRDRMGQRVTALVMDGERPGLAPGFDLIASSLAAQWFEDLEGTLGRLAGLLAPGGLLAVTTLASGTFDEWRRAHAGLGLEAATPAYPTLSALKAIAIAGCTVEASSEPVIETHTDGQAFVAALRAIGAGTPAAPAPLSPGALRRVLRRFEAGGATVTYEVATLLIRHGRRGEPSSPAPLVGG